MEARIGTVSAIRRYSESQLQSPAPKPLGTMVLIGRFATMLGGKTRVVERRRWRRVWKWDGARG